VSTIWGDLLWCDGGWSGSCHEGDRRIKDRLSAGQGAFNRCQARLRALVEPSEAATTRRSRSRATPVRPEEDAGFLPRRDGTDQPRCYGAARDVARPAERNDMLELQGLTRRYGEVVALDDLSFTVAEGQMFGFVGPNGAGKTTAMRIVLGVLEPDAGQVFWRGSPIDEQTRRRTGYMPEDHGQTFPSLVRLPACHRHAGNAGTTLR
jgi:ABC-type glutathione transport system ATPase component